VPLSRGKRERKGKPCGVDPVILVLMWIFVLVLHRNGMIPKIFC
jgi:hypothetical protein